MSGREAWDAVGLLTTTPFVHITEFVYWDKIANKSTPTKREREREREKERERERE